VSNLDRTAAAFQPPQINIGTDAANGRGFVPGKCGRRLSEDPVLLDARSLPVFTNLLTGSSSKPGKG